MVRAQLCGAMLCWCACALPDVAFRCEPGGGCAQADHLCGDDGVCRPADTVTFTPGSGPPGTVVTVRAPGLDGALDVRLGGVSALVLRRSPTTAVVLVPSDATSERVEVQSDEPTRLSTATFQVGPSVALSASTSHVFVRLDASGCCALALSADGQWLRTPDGVFVSETVDAVGALSVDGQVALVAGSRSNGTGAVRVFSAGQGR